MSALMKFLIGLAATLLMGWVHHGPLGGGAALIDGLEGQAKTAVARTEVPGVQVRLGRDPLTRTATLSGPADRFQREGRGELKGIDDLVSEIEGVSGIKWADATAGGSRVMPLLLETLLALTAAYLIGLAFARLLFRPKKEGYL